jgi:putative nucleotide binding protein
VVVLVKDESLIVLDFLARGHATSRKGEPTVQGIGKKYFNLLEVVTREGQTSKVGDELYIGEGERDKVKYIKGRIKYDQLTNFAKSELEHIIDDLIEDNEERFVNFFNIAGPVSTRLHTLELLQGVGKKHMWAIIKERKNKKFESFADLKKRVEMLPDPKKMVKKRIIEELKETDRYKLFVV